MCESCFPCRKTESDDDEDFEMEAEYEEVKTTSRRGTRWHIDNLLHRSDKKRENV